MAFISWGPSVAQLERDGVDSETAQNVVAIHDEVRRLRKWLKPEVLVNASGPCLWMWACPIMGLLAISGDGDWYTCPMGYDERRKPQPLDINPTRICSATASPSKVAREIIGFGLTDVLSTYVMAPPRMQDRKFNSEWASNELFKLANDGLVSPPKR